MLHLHAPSVRMKVSDWRLWAYTDGSCLTYKSQLRVGAGVFIPATKTAIYVNSGGVGISNTIAEQSRTDRQSFCTKGKSYPHSHGWCLFSISDTETTLISLKKHRKDTHCKLLEQIVSMINESDTPINFYKVKAHIGVIGNEFADAIDKHAALHDYGHDEAFPPTSPDCNPFARMSWLAEEKNETTTTTNTTTKISLPISLHHNKTLRTN